MKFIGHVSCTTIVAVPVIYYRSQYPELLQASNLSDYQLLLWSGFFGVIPDIDIILQRYLPIKHRGYLTHSLPAALIPALLVFGTYIAGTKAIIPVIPFINPLTAFLAFLGIFLHLMGDSLTKTGIPLLKPKVKWHFPIIGGYAAFDNYFLNAIPLAIAGFIVYQMFGWDPNMLKGLGKFRHFKNFIPKGPSV